MSLRQHIRTAGLGRGLACVLSLLLTACGAIASPATLTPTPSTTPQVVATRLTDQLTGLSGTMNISIANGAHSYEFAYSLPGAH